MRDTGNDKASASAARRSGILLGFAALASIWLALVAQKSMARASNVDDYLYASYAGRLGASLHEGLAPFLQALLDTGPYSPLFLAPAGIASAIGLDVRSLPTVQSLFLLVYVGSGLALAGAVHPSAGRARNALAVGASAASPLLMGWAVMIHFGVAAAALSMASLAAYARSRQLTSPRWGLLLGAAVGMLSLTRSLAPIYVAAIGVAIAVDLSVRRSWRVAARGFGAAALALVAVAGPWWAVSGRTTLDYLLSAGIRDDSPFTQPMSLLGKVSFRWEVSVSEAGRLPVALLVILLVLALRPSSGWLDRVLPIMPLLVFGFATYAGLSISTNAGTAFSLPAFQALLLAGLLGSSPRHGNSAILVTSVAAITLVLATVAGALSVGRHSGPPALPGMPWRELLREADAYPSILPPEQVTASVALVLRERNGAVHVGRDDAAFNIEGLRYELGALGGANSIGAWQWESGPADGDEVFILGKSGAPYQTTDQSQAEEALSRQGLSAQCAFVVSDGNTVVLWSRFSLSLCSQAGGVTDLVGLTAMPPATTVEACNLEAVDGQSFAGAPLPLRPGDAVSGWLAGSPGRPAEDSQLWLTLDGSQGFPIPLELGGDRLDVAETLSDPAQGASGFGQRISLWFSDPDVTEPYRAILTFRDGDQILACDTERLVDLGR